MKKTKNKNFAWLILLGLICSFTACMPVAPYQRSFLNSQDMQLTNNKISVFETNIQAYREGASGANGGKIGGGCGCN